ncbi:MAG TPA: BA14K family protein [Beijerinckiaceae bacterium]|nr:BA14K family protein [Beijerinckiaceae bacterium]
MDGRLADWCARRYRTFDPITGTFMAPSGERLVCTYP